VCEGRCEEKEDGKVKAHDGGRKSADSDKGLLGKGAHHEDNLKD